MFRINGRIARIATLSALALACSSALYAADITLKLGHLANEDNSWHKGSLKFAEEVKALTKGTVEVKVFANDALGKEMDLINGMQLGTADMLITGESLQVFMNTHERESPGARTGRFEDGGQGLFQ